MHDSNSNHPDPGGVSIPAIARCVGFRGLTIVGRSADSNRSALWSVGYLFGGEILNSNAVVVDAAETWTCGDKVAFKTIVLTHDSNPEELNFPYEVRAAHEFVRKLDEAVETVYDRIEEMITVNQRTRSHELVMPTRPHRMGGGLVAVASEHDVVQRTLRVADVCRQAWQSWVDIEKLRVSFVTRSRKPAKNPWILPGELSGATVHLLPETVHPWLPACAGA